MSALRTYRRGIFRLLLVGVVLAALVAPGVAARTTRDTRTFDDAAVAEEDDPSAPPANEAASADRNLFTILKGGGAMMVPIFACSFLLLVFVFERAISLRRGRVIPAPFVKRMLHQLKEGKLDREGALDLCNEAQSPVSDVVAAAVKKWGRPSVEIEQAVIDAEERAAAGLRRYLRLFNGIANISPLLGLLGTTFGMIRLFSDIAKSDAMGRTELLAAGISEALLTTAGGLSVAIPGLCFYLFFVSRVERLMIEVDSVGQDVVGLVSAEALHDGQSRVARANRRGTAA